MFATLKKVLEEAKKAMVSVEKSLELIKEEFQIYSQDSTLADSNCEKTCYPHVFIGVGSLCLLMSLEMLWLLCFNPSNLGFSWVEFL